MFTYVQRYISSLFMGCSIWREVIFIGDLSGFSPSPKVNCRVSVLNTPWPLLYAPLRVQFHKPSSHHYMFLTSVDAAWIMWRETDRLKFILVRLSTTLLSNKLRWLLVPNFLKKVREIKLMFRANFIPDFVPFFSFPILFRFPANVI